MDDLESLAERYLLGELDETELEAVELRLEDDTFFRRVQLAEDELIDAYLADELDADRRQRFESHFLLAPERRRRLRVSQLLVADSQQRQAAPPRRRAWAIALVAAVVLATAVSWTTITLQKLSEAHHRNAAELVVDLDLGVLRGAQRPTYPLTEKARPVRLRITADPRDLAEPVELVLRDAGGVEHWRGPAESGPVEGGPPEGGPAEPKIELVLPGGLPAGSYELEALARTSTGSPTPIGYAYFDLRAD